MLAFDAATHTYRWGQQIIPSVTQILADLIPYPVSVAQWYLDRGRAVHACAALLAQGKTFKHDPAIDGQVAALNRFYREVRPEIIAVEQMHIHPARIYAGTCDLWTRIGTRLCIVDFKASSDIERTTLQMGGYSAFPRAPAHGVEVEVRDDGTYSMSPIINLRGGPRASFLAMASVWHVRERMGYHKTKGEMQQ